MVPPPLLILADEAAYHAHFLTAYVRGQVFTRDGIRVHFNVNKFSHAFFESTQRNSVKDQFSQVRAQRMDWISHTLLDPQADWYQGWMKQLRSYDVTRCATVACGDFVVVLNFRAKKLVKLCRIL